LNNAKTTENKKDPAIFQLYVAGNTLISMKAIANVKAILENHFKNNYILDVLDIIQHPGLAITENVLAVPLLIRKHPLPEIQLIGDFTDPQKIVDDLRIVAK
jgi:circadian clock protein KaiB